MKKSMLCQQINVVLSFFKKICHFFRYLKFYKNVMISKGTELFREGFYSIICFEK